MTTGDKPVTTQRRETSTVRLEHVARSVATQSHSDPAKRQFRGSELAYPMIYMTSASNASQVTHRREINMAGSSSSERLFTH